jgi:hypothetical protein
MQNGIIYRGPSLYDGAPIVVVATFTTANRKTGGVVQTYILRDDVDPRDASKGGQDVSICGSCPHRGEVNDDPARKIAKNRTCYVNLGQGVLITWRALQRGVYPDAQDVASRAAIGAGRVVRVGTYGDPAAVPQEIWTDLLRDAASWTAYTHSSGWRPDIAMQSADNYHDAVLHWPSWTPHFPRGHRCGAHRSCKRDPMSSIQGSRRAHHVRSLPAVRRDIHQVTKEHRDPHALNQLT